LRLKRARKWPIGCQRPQNRRISELDKILSINHLAIFVKK